LDLDSLFEILVVRALKFIFISTDEVEGLMEIIWLAPSIEFLLFALIKESLN
jgi:hypothetical protein